MDKEPCDLRVQYDYDDSFDPQTGGTRQCCGYTMAFLNGICSFIYGIVLLGSALKDPQSPATFKIGNALAFLGSWWIGVFFITSMSSPRYLGGKPSALKIIPLSLGLFLMIAGLSVAYSGTWLAIAFAILPTSFSSLIAYLLYFGDDDSGSFWLCFKPWIIKTPKALK